MVKEHFANGSVPKSTFSKKNKKIQETQVMTTFGNSNLIIKQRDC